MIEIRNADQLNPFELLIVYEKFKREGVKYATIQPGSRCIWTTYSGINEYFIFRDGLLVDRVID